MNTPPLLWLVAIAKTLRAVDRTVLERVLSRGSPGSLAVWSRLAQTADGLGYAVPLFLRVREFYDAQSQKTIAAMLRVTSALAA